MVLVIGGLSKVIHSAFMAKTYTGNTFFLQLAWAPGKGVKGKEYKEYFDADRGVAFIPWSKLGTSVDLEALSEGGWIDPQTLPPGLQKPVVQEGID